ncbi:caspase family protein [bacterium]|nr:caspase family protein [bacterium]
MNLQQWIMYQQAMQQVMQRRGRQQAMQQVMQRRSRQQAMQRRSMQQAMQRRRRQQAMQRRRRQQAMQRRGRQQAMQRRGRQQAMQRRRRQQAMQRRRRQEEMERLRVQEEMERLRVQEEMERRRRRQLDNAESSLLAENKYALLVGINYIGTKYALNGCINDIHNIRNFLLKRGYNDENITLLSDENSQIMPTKMTILEGLKKLLEAGEKGDQLYFHYSGHGGQLRDNNGDEMDGRDECLYSCDMVPISDDELKYTIYKYIKPGVSLVCLIDSCNSGTGLDLRFNCNNQNNDLITDNRQIETNGNVYMISGCKSDQTSADAYINGSYAGAMTASFLAKYESNLLWGDLLEKMRGWLKKYRFTQIPQFSSGRDILLNTKICI